MFISSPSDVSVERAHALEVISELAAEPFIRRLANLQAVSWDDPSGPAPILANMPPQAALNMYRPRPSECEVVVGILWARMGTPLASEDGSSDVFLSGTEWELNDALRGSGNPKVLLYTRTETPTATLAEGVEAYGRRVAQYAKVQSFLSRLQNEDGSLAGQAVGYDTAPAFARRLKADLREVVCAELSDGRAGHWRVEADPGPTWSGSPYPGLRALTPSESAIFFGRDRELDGLLTRMKSEARATVIVGSSGCGKSSVLRAGLLPRLSLGAISGSDRWLTADMSPAAFGDDPLVALAASVLPFTRQMGSRPAAFAATMDASIEPGSFVDGLLAGRPPSARLLLVVDQLEEIFLCRRSAVERYLGVLSRLLEYHRVCLVSSLRADFLEQCCTFPELGRILQEGTFVIGPPTTLAIADIITRPAALAGIAIDEGLTDAILSDAGQDPGQALPLVAFCLEKLEGLSGGRARLNFADYERIGRLQGAVGQWASEIVVRLEAAAPDRIERALEALFAAVVRVEASGRATRRHASLDRLMSADQPVPVLVSTLIAPGRLLLADGDGAGSSVTLAHEALLESWPALTGWVRRNRSELQRLEGYLVLLGAERSSDREHAVSQLGLAENPNAEVVRAILGAKDDPEPAVRRAVSVALGRIGALSDDVLPHLVDATCDADAEVRSASARSLGAIGSVREAEVAALVRAGCDPEARVRRSAADALGSIGEARDVSPALSVLLRDADERVRAAAARAVSRSGGCALSCMPVLLTNIADRDQDVAEHAAAAIVVAARSGPAVFDDVVQQLSLRELDVGVRLAKVLAGIVATDPGMVRRLAKLLADPDPRVRGGAAFAASELGAAAAPIASELIESLDDEFHEVRACAVKALAQGDAGSPGAVSAIVGRLADPDGRVIRAALDAVRVLSARSPAVTALLVDALGGTDTNLRAGAAEAMAACVSASAEIVPALTRALDDVDAPVRYQAAGSLGRLREAAYPSISALLSAILDDDDRSVAEAAIHAVVNIAPRDPIVVSRLTTVLRKSDDPVLLSVAMRGLVDVQPSTPEIIDAFRRVFRSEPTRRAEAAERMGQLVPANEDVTSDLILGLGDDDYTVRAKSAAALGKLAPFARRAIPALMLLLQDQQSSVRESAARTLSILKN